MKSRNRLLSTLAYCCQVALGLAVSSYSYADTVSGSISYTANFIDINQTPFVFGQPGPGFESVPPFDASLGTLQSIDILLTTTLGGSMYAYDLPSGSQPPPQVTITEQAEFTGPYGAFAPVYIDYKTPISSTSISFNYQNPYVTGTTYLFSPNTQSQLFHIADGLSNNTTDGLAFYVRTNTQVLGNLPPQNYLVNPNFVDVTYGITMAYSYNYAPSAVPLDSPLSYLGVGIATFALALAATRCNQSLAA